MQVWDLESFACMQTLEHEGVPVQLLEIAGTRLHSVAGRTVRLPLSRLFQSPGMCGGLKRHICNPPGTSVS